MNNVNYDEGLCLIQFHLNKFSFITISALSLFNISLPRCNNIIKQKKHNNLNTQHTKLCMCIPLSLSMNMNNFFFFEINKRLTIYNGATWIQIVLNKIIVQ